jgi:uncharacterized protein YndB with AHSA1/START domain
MNASVSPGQHTAPGEVTFTRLLPGPIERAWEFLTDPEKRGKWLAAGSLEARVGGRIELHFRHASLSEEKKPPPNYAHLAGGTDLTGSITRFRPPALFGFTWETGKAPSEVLFELTPEDRRVRLVLTHRSLPDSGAERSVAAGWHLHLDLLQASLEGAPPPPYWTELLRLKGEYDRLFAAE